MVFAERLRFECPLVILVTIIIVICRKGIAICKAILVSPSTRLDYPSWILTTYLVVTHFQKPRQQKPTRHRWMDSPCFKSTHPMFSSPLCNSHSVNPDLAVLSSESIPKFYENSIYTGCSTFPFLLDLERRTYVLHSSIQALSMPTDLPGTLVDTTNDYSFLAFVRLVGVVYFQEVNMLPSSTDCLVHF